MFLRSVAISLLFLAALNLAQAQTAERVRLSGAVLTRDTDHFRIHYTLQGGDATAEDYVAALSLSLEEIWRIQIGQMGFPPPIMDGQMGGDNRYDVYLADLLGNGEEAFGYVAPDDWRGDNPATPAVETAATSTYMVIENDFDDAGGEPDDTPISLMRTTAAHEFNHAIQFGYDADERMNWYYEATASWMETAALVKDEAATDYVKAVFDYPELCFGVEDDPTGEAMYGSWLFIQDLVDAYGIEALRRLWENIVVYEGFDSLAATLAAYGTTIPEMLARYHLRNLVRDYNLAPDFDAAVWLEATIDDVGRWTYNGSGVQELGVNFFALTLSPGTYYAGLINDGGVLELRFVGVRGDEADVVMLNRGGNITTTGYDNAYLVVFNPIYDNNVYDCAYYEYEIDLVAAKGAVVPAEEVLNAANFVPLR